MDRVRAGLTGLGLVFLFTLLASVAFAPSPTQVPEKAPGEPLAQLGVAPSSENLTSDTPDTPVASPEADAAEQPMAAVPDAALSAVERGETPAPI
jgi:hypothetical protein